MRQTRHHLATICLELGTCCILVTCLPMEVQVRRYHLLVLEGNITPLWTSLAFCLEIEVVCAEVAGGLRLPGLINLSEAAFFFTEFPKSKFSLFLCGCEVGRVVLGGLE